MPAESAELTAGDAGGQGQIDGDVPGRGLFPDMRDEPFLLLHAKRPHLRLFASGLTVGAPGGHRPEPLFGSVSADIGEDANAIRRGLGRNARRQQLLPKRLHLLPRDSLLLPQSGQDMLLQQHRIGRVGRRFEHPLLLRIPCGIKLCEGH